MTTLCGTAWAQEVPEILGQQICIDQREPQKTTGFPANKGGVQIIKMEILDGFCHEGGGSLEGVSSATYLF